MHTPDASASIPELRTGRAWMWILVGGGAVMTIAAIVVAIVVIKKDIDPGALACDRLVDLRTQEPGRWDRFDAALANTAVYRVYNTITHARARVTASDPDGRCRQSMAAFRDAVTYRRYEELVDCMAHMTSPREGSHCFDNL